MGVDYCNFYTSKSNVISNNIDDLDARLSKEIELSASTCMKHMCPAACHLGLCDYKKMNIHNIKCYINVCPTELNFCGNVLKGSLY